MYVSVYMFTKAATLVKVAVIGSKRIWHAVDNAVVVLVDARTGAIASIGAIA